MNRRTMGCQHRPLARGRTCAVDACDHGKFHVNLGALTLHIDETQLRETVATLEEALACLDARDRARPPRLLC